jgi:hypothetical protein
VVVQGIVVSRRSEVTGGAVTQRRASVTGEVSYEGIPLEERRCFGYMSVPKMRSTCHVNSYIPDVLI